MAVTPTTPSHLPPRRMGAAVASDARPGEQFVDDLGRALSGSLNLR